MKTFGSLFTGAGGFDLGFERAGMRCLWQCEIDKNCGKLLRNKWPAAKLHTDINTFNPDDHECPDAICFGSPCQDLSVAGLRAGIHDGERSNLFFVAVRIIRRFVERGLELAIWEQVPGVFSSDAGRDFACVLRAMAECGAVDVAWGVMDAQYRNVAQRRERVFLVIDFRKERAAEILSLADGMSGHPAPSRKAGQGVAGTISSRATGGGGLGTDFDLSGGLIPEISFCLNAGAMGCCDSETETMLPVIGHLNGTDIQDGGERSNCLSVGQGSQPDTIIAFNHQAGGSRCPISPRNDQSNTLQVGQTQAIAFQESQTGVREYAEAGTLRAGGPGHDPVGTRLRTPTGVRRLTPLECERLMGWPDNWTAGFADSVRYRMCGNGVVATVSEWIGKRVVKALAP